MKIILSRKIPSRRNNNNEEEAELLLNIRATMFLLFPTTPTASTDKIFFTKYLPTRSYLSLSAYHNLISGQLTQSLLTLLIFRKPLTG